MQHNGIERFCGECTWPQGDGQCWMTKQYPDAANPSCKWFSVKREEKKEHKADEPEKGRVACQSR